MKTLKDCWGTFESIVIPPTASETQRTEMKKSFYAGAVAILNLQEGVSDPSVSEDQAIAVLESLHKECQNFVVGLHTLKA